VWTCGRDREAETGKCQSMTNRSRVSEDLTNEWRSKLT
jgi:hypothetical protein